jgi:hypothetical protein
MITSKLVIALELLGLSKGQLSKRNL